MAAEKKDNNLFSYSKLFLLLTCVFIATSYLSIGERIEFFRSIRFEFIIGLILSIVAVFKLLEFKDEASLLRKHIILFYLVLLIQIPFSFDFDVSLDVFINGVVKYSLLALIIVAFIRAPEALKILIAVYLLVCFRLLFEGFLGWKSGNLVWQNQGVMRLHGSVSALGHPNSFSSFAICLLPYIYFLFFHVRNLFKLFFIIMLMFAVIVIIFTGSRSGYVATIGFFLVLLLRSRNKLKVGILVMIVTTLVWSFLPEQYVERFQSIYSVEHRQSGSSDARVQIMADAIDISIKHPFGVGIEAFSKVRNMYFNRSQNIHNLYLEVLTNLGVQGFIVWSLFIIAIFKILRKSRNRFSQVLEKINRTSINDSDFIEKTKDRRDIIWLEALSIALSYSLLMRLFLGMFGMDLYYIHWWLIIGIALVIDRMAKIYYMVYIKSDEIKISVPDYTKHRQNQKSGLTTLRSKQSG